MFWSKDIPSAPHDIYSSSFAPIQHGYALWIPEPQKHGEPQIGDVGFFVAGGFHRLFSLDTRDPSRKVTTRPVPFDPSEPLPPELLDTHTTSRKLVAKSHCTYGVKATETFGSVDAGVGSASAGVSAKYACVAAQGAVLDLQSAADAEVLYRNTLLKEYILRNHSRWVAYATETLHLDVKPEDIVFVSGAVKARPDWAVMAFSNTLKSYDGSISGRVSGIGGIAAGHSHKALAIGAEMERYGEHYIQGGNNPQPLHAGAPQDQSILLERFMVRRWLGVLKTMSAGAGYDRSPGGQGGPGGNPEEASTESIEPDVTERVLKNGDRIESLLEYMFETSGVGIAVASDSDVMGILGGRLAVDFSSYLRKIQPPVYVDGQVGWISIEDVIANERKQLIARRHITESVMTDWPNASQDASGYLDHAQVSVWPRYGRRSPSSIPILAFDSQLDQGSRCIAVSRDGKYLAASIGRSGIMVWRTTDGLCIQHIRDQREAIIFLAFSPDYRTLVSAGESRYPAVWDIRTGRLLFRLEGHSKGNITRVTYAPTGPFIATYSHGEKVVKIWDARSGTCLNSYRPRDDVTHLTFSPSSNQLYIQLTTDCVTYDLAVQDVTAAFTGIRRADGKKSFAISPGGESLALFTASHILQVHDLRSGRETSRIKYTSDLAGPVAFSPDGRELLAGCPDERSVVAFDVDKGVPSRVYRASSEVYSVSYGRNGEYVVAGCMGGDVEVFDAESARHVATFHGTEDIEDLVCQPEHDYVFVRPAKGPVRMYNITDIDRLM